MIIFFFFNDPATTEIYPLPLHDALPIFEDIYVTCVGPNRLFRNVNGMVFVDTTAGAGVGDPSFSASAAWVDYEDRKSTRLNSSHANISYAVFCLKKKKNTQHIPLLVLYN